MLCLQSVFNHLISNVFVFAFQDQSANTIILKHHIVRFFSSVYTINVGAIYMCKWLIIKFHVIFSC